MAACQLPVEEGADRQAPNSWGALFRGANLFRSTVLAGGAAIHALSLRVVVTVLPAAVGEIGGLRFFSWTMTVAMVSAIWGAAFAAPLARARGLRSAYWVALPIFAVGSIVCAAAPDMAAFLAGRLLQGLGGGLLTALAYATISLVFPPRLHARAIAMVSGVWSVAALSGPLFGGVLAQWGLWRWAFWIDVPFAAAVGAVARRATLMRTGEAADSNSGLPTIAFGRLALLGASVMVVAIGGVAGRASLSGLALSLSTGLLIVLLRLDARIAGRVGDGRLLPTGAFNPATPLGVASLTIGLLGGCTMAVVYVPYVVVQAGHHLPLAGGYLSAVISLAWALGALIGASAGEGWARRFIIAGPVLVTLGLVLTAWSLTTDWLALIALSLGLIGLGIGIAWAHLGSLLVRFASAAERDVAAAFISITNLLSQALGAAFAGMVANLAGFGDPGLGPHRIVWAACWVFLLSAIFPAAALPAACRVVRLYRQAEAFPDHRSTSS